MLNDSDGACVSKQLSQINLISSALKDLVPQELLESDARLVTAVFEGNRVEPERMLRDKQGRSMKVVAAPEVLNYRHDLPNLIGFLTKFRRAVLRKDRRVLLDLSECRSIDIVACLLLTAEAQRCAALVPEYVHGCDPLGADALEILRQFGYHEQVGIKSAPPVGDPQWVATIRSGQGANQVSPQMAEIATLAYKAWGDQAFADQIHAALNEAMTNVIMHAYPSEAIEDTPCLPGRWWAAGVINLERNEAWFFALDQGIGLPRTAIRNFSGLLARFEIDPNAPNDHLVMAAAIKEARTQTGLDQHGKGLNSMIRLIDEKSVGGSILIASRTGEYMMVKNPTKTDPRLQRIDFSRLLPADLPGTLIVWKVNGPLVRNTSKGDGA